MLKIKLQYIGHLMQRANSFENTLMLGKIETERTREKQKRWLDKHHQLDGCEFEQTLGGSKLWRRAEPAVLQFMESKGYGQHLVPEEQQ